MYQASSVWKTLFPRNYPSPMAPKIFLYRSLSLEGRSLMRTSHLEFSVPISDSEHPAIDGASISMSHYIILMEDTGRGDEEKRRAKQ